MEDNGSCRRDTLAKIRCIERAGGTPVFFADSNPPFTKRWAGPASSRIGLAALDTVAATLPVELDIRHYRLVARANGAAMLYPAAALYAVRCQTAGCAPPPVDGSGWSRKFDRDVDVVWGVDVTDGPTWSERPFSQTLRYLQDDASPRCKPWKRGFGPSVARFVGLATEGLERKAHASCTYTDAMPYRLLQSGISLEEARQALGGRIVLVGANLSGANDVVPATPYGAVPGLFYHAMALDNLIQRGAAYPKAPRPVFPGLTLDTTQLDDVIGFFAVTFVLAWPTARIAKRNRRPRKLTRLGWARRAALFLTFVMVVIWLAFIFSGGVAVFPESFNVAAITLACVIGLAELGKELTEPIWRPSIAAIPFVGWVLLGDREEHGDD